MNRLGFLKSLVVPIAVLFTPTRVKSATSDMEPLSQVSYAMWRASRISLSGGQDIPLDWPSLGTTERESWEFATKCGLARLSGRLSSELTPDQIKLLWRTSGEKQG